MGGSDQTSTSSTSPPPQFLDAYYKLLQQAQGIAQQPLKQYTGDIVAGLSDDQQSAIKTIQDSQGINAPYINSAAQYFNSAATPVTTDAPAIAAQFGNRAANIAGSEAANAKGIATAGAGQANQAAGQGVGIAQAGALQGATAAQQAAGTDVWSQLPSFASGINTYMTPYTQQVVDATQRQFDNQNAQQQQGGISQAIKGGAWGGDRAGVAAGIMAGQQQLAQAPVIAGLYNQGFQNAAQNYQADKTLQGSLGQNRASLMANTALGSGNLLSNTGVATGQLGANTALSGATLGSNTALNAGNMGINAANVGGQLGIAGQQQSLAAQQANATNAMNAGTGIASLGNQAQNAALTGAQAQMGAGNLERQVTQQQLNVPYQQFLQQQGYPFQTTNWLGGLEASLGSSAGGTSTTTQPGPDPFMQAAGLGIGLAGLFLKRGGAVKDDEDARLEDDVMDQGISYVPVGGKIPMGSGPPKPPEAQKETDPMGNTLGISDAIDGFGDKLSKSKDMARLGAGAGQDLAPGMMSGIDAAIGKLPLGFMPGFARGGIAHYADGGDTTPDNPVFEKSSKGVRGIDVPMLSTKRAPSPGIAENLKKNYGNDPNNADGSSKLPSSTYWPDADPWWSNNPAHRSLDPNDPTNLILDPNAKENLIPEGGIGAGGYNFGGGQISVGPDGLPIFTPNSTEPGVDGKPPKMILNPNLKVGDPGAKTILNPDLKVGGKGAGKTIINPALTNPNGTSANPMDMAYLLSGMQFKQGGGIQSFDAGGGLDDDDDLAAIEVGDLDDGFEAPRSTIPAASTPGGIAPHTPPFSTHPISAQPHGADMGSFAKSEITRDQQTGLPEKGTGIDYDRYRSTYKPTAYEDTSEEDHKKARANAIATAGFAMAASRSPHALSALGEGAVQGMKAYSEMTAADKKRAERLREKADDSSYHAASLDQAAQRFADTIATQRQRVTQQGEYQTGELSLRRSMGESTQHYRDRMLALKEKEAAGKGDIDQDYVDERANALANYMEKPLSAFERKTKQGQAIAVKTRELNPDYREQNYQASQTGYTRFTSGKQGDTIKSFNTAIHHLATLRTLSEALNNGDVAIANQIKNAIAREFGDPDINTYEDAAKIVADETAKAILPGGGTGADRAEYVHGLLSKWGSKAQSGVIDTRTALMVGQLSALEKQYKSATFRKDFDDLLEDEAKKTYHDPRYAAGHNPTKDVDSAAAPLPVLRGDDGKPKIDRAQIKPDVTYNTKQGPKLGKDILGGGP